MSRPRLILCNGVSLPDDSPDKSGRYVKEFNTRGVKRNVNLQIEDVSDPFTEQLTPRLTDLLEIATYVYTADAATVRSGNWTADDSLEPWERDYRFIIAVRDFDFWERTEVKDLLVETLQHLSDDHYEFDFRKLQKKDHDRQEYFQLGPNSLLIKSRKWGLLARFSSGFMQLARVQE